MSEQRKADDAAECLVRTKRMFRATRARVQSAVAALEVVIAAYARARREIVDASKPLLGDDSWVSIHERMHNVSTSIEELGRLLRRERDGR